MGAIERTSIGVKPPWVPTVTSAITLPLLKSISYILASKFNPVPPVPPTINLVLSQLKVMVQYSVMLKIPVAFACQTIAPAVLTRSISAPVPCVI